MNCPVTCGRPTRMSAEAFARMCAERRDKDNKYCADCNGRPPEVEVINMGGKAMAVTKQSTRIIAEKDEELAALKAEIVERDRKIEGLLTVVGNWEKKSGQYNERIAELEAELAAFRSATADPAGIMQDIDLSAGIYRDALADFAIRVLSGGVAVSFHEARP